MDTKFTDVLMDTSIEDVESMNNPMAIPSEIVFNGCYWRIKPEGHPSSGINMEIELFDGTKIYKEMWQERKTEKENTVKNIKRCSKFYKGGKVIK